MNLCEKKFEFAILVVLYNCRIRESRTLNSLLNFSAFLSEKEGIVCVWNNGPRADPNFREYGESLKRSDKLSYLYAESKGNTPLSKIYNLILSNISAESYLILDQDSLLSLDFLASSVGRKGVDLGVPHIMVDNDMHGPMFNSEVLREDAVFKLDPTTDFFAVGSGLVIYRSALNKLLRHYSVPFDERFALYGVDYTFWIRMMALAHRENILVSCDSSIEHSLSRLEKESVGVSKFRRKERGLDTGITLRRYPSKRRILNVIKFILKRPFIRKPLPGYYPSVLWIGLGFVMGKHPRCNSSSIQYSLYD